MTQIQNLLLLLCYTIETYNLLFLLKITLNYISGWYRKVKLRLQNIQTVFMSQ